MTYDELEMTYHKSKMTYVRSKMAYEKPKMTVVWSKMTYNKSKMTFVWSKIIYQKPKTRNQKPETLIFVIMNLIIDIGNTQTKFALFDGDKMIESWTGSFSPFREFEKKLKSLTDVRHCIISTVLDASHPIPATIKKKFPLIFLEPTTPVPIKNKYQTPKTLGNDRLANAVGATVVFPKKNVLIIDMGTCIKYDFVDKKKNYHGGAISPGLQMRFKALKHFTAKLPLIKPSKNFPLTGKNTQESISSGVQNGIIFEINGMIDQYQKKHDELKVILTGGDQTFFADHLKSSIFAAPNLTLQGLNEILNYNVLKKS